METTINEVMLKFIKKYFISCVLILMFTTEEKAITGTLLHLKPIAINILQLLTVVTQSSILDVTGFHSDL